MCRYVSREFSIFLFFSSLLLRGKSEYQQGTKSLAEQKTGAGFSFAGQPPQVTCGEKLWKLSSAKESCRRKKGRVEKRRVVEENSEVKQK